MDPLYNKRMIKNMTKDFSVRPSLKNWRYLRCPKLRLVKWVKTNLCSTMNAKQ